MGHKNGLIWYQDDATRRRFGEICEDKENFVRPYSAWLADAEKLIETMAEKGMMVIKVKANPDDFLRWCQVNAHKPNQRARTLFAYVKATEIVGNG